MHLCPRQLIDLDVSNFEFWFLIFSTAPACRKHQQIFDIQNATRPNGLSAEDITYSINHINMLMHNNKNAPAENNFNPLCSFVLCILLTKSTVENHAVVFSDSDYYVSYIHDSSKLYSARQNCAVGNIYNRSQTLMKTCWKHCKFTDFSLVFRLFAQSCQYKGKNRQMDESLVISDFKKTLLSSAR